MKLLVLKLSALGDFVQSAAAMARIRAAHPDAHITLLTTPPYGPLGEALGLFDAVRTDGRPKGLAATLAVWTRLRAERFDRIYDLQTSDRSSGYLVPLARRWTIRGGRLIVAAPEWSGIAPFASHPHANPVRDSLHTLERQADQLRFAGIWPDAPTGPGAAPPPDLSRLLGEAPAGAFGLTPPYALLVPGAAPHRPKKRWPAAEFAALAAALKEQGLAVAVIGGPAETPLAAQIPGAVDLTGKTSFVDLARLGAGAALVVGNDTGPTHILAATGAPTVALFSGDSDPALCAPRGISVFVLRESDLNHLNADRVINLSVPMLRRA